MGKQERFPEAAFRLGLREQPTLVILLHFTVSGEASHGVWSHSQDLLYLSVFHISSQGVATAQLPRHTLVAMCIYTQIYSMYIFISNCNI